MLIEIDTPFDQLPIKKCGLIYSSNKTSGKTQIESYQSVCVIHMESCGYAIRATVSKKCLIMIKTIYNFY